MISTTTYFQNEYEEREGNLASNSYYVFRECCNRQVEGRQKSCRQVEGRRKSCLGVFFQVCFQAIDGRFLFGLFQTILKWCGRWELFPRSKKQF